MNANKAQELLFEAMVFGASGMIERQESQGQASFVASTDLPIKGDWDKLKEMGVEKGENIDKLFCSATLPQGWTKVATAHSMWSNLLDARGIIRASIFYKAAFYDQDAFIKCISKRFIATQYHDRCDKSGLQFVVEDVGRQKVVRIFEPAYYALLNNILGVVHKGKFYSKTNDDPYKAIFIDNGVDGQNARTITRDEFYKTYHNREVSRYDLIDAIEELAKRDAISWIETIPSDESQWTEAFDFPKI